MGVKMTPMITRRSAKASRSFVKRISAEWSARLQPSGKMEREALAERR
jgi:hypothetical protein